ncbi:hypothetical protein [Leptospira noguchii]|uniref:hypothetical protein n=1 Tax=Leptospira noguchii TaxID=28182 RepID=UPI000569B3AD|nr:hypothetical protein [Leptospira noguchii]
MFSSAYNTKGINARELQAMLSELKRLASIGARQIALNSSYNFKKFFIVGFAKLLQFFYFNTTET